MKRHRFTARIPAMCTISEFRYRTPFLLLAIGLILSHGSQAQSEREISFPRVNIGVSDKAFKKIKRIKGQKIKLDQAVLDIDGEILQLTELQLRGKSTLYFERKSFSVDLSTPVRLRFDGAEVSLKAFNLLNLAMDKNLWHNRWSFLVMNRLGIFPPFNIYCTLTINGRPQGIYLLVEKPQHAMTGLKSPYMIRRGFKSSINKEYAREITKTQATAFRHQFRSLYNTDNLHGPALYEHLAGAMNIRKYFIWLAFNYWIMNGDYSDELFMYINPDTYLYEPIAWDYDDIFQPEPHEGKQARNQTLDERLIYSIEDALDRTIASDDLIYSKYCSSIVDMLQLADSVLVVSAANKVARELEILNGQTKLEEHSHYMDQTPFNLATAVSDLNNTMKHLHHRRLFIQKILNSRE